MLTLPYYLQSLRWMVPAGCMLGSSPAYYAVWLGWRCVTSVLPVRIYEAGDEVLYSLYQRLILFFFENLSGIEVCDAFVYKKRPQFVGHGRTR